VVCRIRDRVQSLHRAASFHLDSLVATLDQCEIQVDCGDSKGFVFLAIDTTPGYTDTQPFPDAPAKWTYQAIYRVADNRVG